MNTSKIKKLLFLLPLVALALTGCQFVHPISISSIPLTPVEKVKLNDNANDLTRYSTYALDSFPSNGGKILVIPIWFTDSDSQIYNRDKVKNDIYYSFFGDRETTGWESVASFYGKESDNQCIITGTVTEWFETNKPSSYYNSTALTSQLVTQACENFRMHVSEEEYNSYDSDKNGLLDSVCLIYGAKHNRLHVGNTNLWAYTFWVQDFSTYTHPIPNTFLWASYDFMYEDTSHVILDTHTYIHEFGHVLGLEDYYDYNSEVGYDAAGMFSMQDCNIGGHDPFSLLELGWIKPYVVSDTAAINIKPFTQSHDLILVANHEVKSVFDEYLLIELYTPDGLNELDASYSYCNNSPKGPSRTGIRLWHVDARLISPTGVSGNKPIYHETGVHIGIDKKATFGNSLVLSNTSYSSDFARDNEDYLAKLGGKYYQYRLLELIKNGDYRERLVGHVGLGLKIWT